MEDDGKLHWDTITEPFEHAIDNLFDYLPQIVGALILVVIAWILAKVVRKVVRKAIATSKIEERVGKGGDIAQRSGQAAWWIVWIFFFLAILETLGVEGMMEPIRLTFEKIFDRLPDVVAAAVILIISWVIGRLLVGWIRNFLTTVRFNEVPVKLGLTKTQSEGNWAPANIVAYIVLALIMLFAVMMAADILEFPTANNLVADFTEFFAQVLLGVVVLAIGVFMAKFVAGLMRAAKQPPALATLVQVFIIVLVSAMGLYTMGFANEIILLAFGLMLGAIAVAVAVAFGMGGREVARDVLESWVKALRSDKSKESNEP
ncbi:MAG: mechanosensitive ion channel [Chloroflexi bacterium]|nr:mechanosensitive ion channel [Chloroflexota bacterium]